MKKTSIFLSLMTAGLVAVAQSPRLSLYEEFTGENCAPCAATNPGLQAILNANTSKAVAIKWQVPIPSAPTPTWSLYQTYKPSIDWRWLGWNASTTSTLINAPTASGYGYPTQNTSGTTTITSGINSAPAGRIDGQHQWTFGAASDHPANLTAGNLATSQAVMSPFAITMNRAWDPTFSTVTVTVSITASQAFTTAGPLLFRLVMVEQEIHFATAPGTNGEKDFYNAARASFPTLQGGTTLPTTWTLGQNQTFTVSCPLPSYIVDKSMVNFVGFIQDDGTRQVKQASTTTTVGLSNDPAVTSIAGSYLSCGANYSPSIVVKNNGTNSITSLTINPALDGTGTAPFTWAGTLAAGASTTFVMPAVAASNGSHTYSVNIVGVSGGIDYNTANNYKSAPFALVSAYLPAPITEAYTAVTFPPTNWFLNNADGGTSTWSRGTPNGFGVAGTGSAKYDFYGNSVVGDADDLYMPPANLTGVSSPLLTFDVAYAQYSTENDKLEVKVSTNCGATWTTVYNKAGTVLMTAPAVTSAFSPSASQWRSESVNMAAYANNPQVLVKFVATSAYGNNLYVDNINLAQTASIANIDKNISSVELYPNPAQNETNVNITVVNAGNVSVSVINNLGQEVSKQATSLNTGSNNVNINTSNLAAGIYNVVISSNEGSTIKKLTVTK